MHGRHGLPEPTRATFAAALELLNLHTMDVTGRCRTCRYLGPCTERENAMRVFKAYLWLPTRRPGATKPELLNAKRIA